ncbi:MAG: hypothetical protein OEV66_01090 [Spirochaetia bacterium]|nr:hypothetical protein [Spirochaetia bacterium]
MKALIIDDNHSFIDLLKNALKPFRLQIDSFYKFSDAREMILKNGCYLNQLNVNEVLRYHDTITKSNGKSNPGLPELNGSLINPDGYALVFLEYDAEPSLKGTHFIQEILRNRKEWSEKNFILLSSDAQRVEALAKKLKISFAEKPVKKDQLMKMVYEHLNSLKQKEQEIGELIKKYGIKTRAPGVETKKRSRSLTTTSKTTKKSTPIKKPVKKISKSKKKADS